MHLFYFQKNKGFSLIETLIAVSILMIAITGPLALVQAGLFSSNHERNQITAIYLAQEAIEYIRVIRDSNSYVLVANASSNATYKVPAVTNWLTGPDRDGTDDNMSTKCATACYVDPHGFLNGTKFLIQKSGTSYLYQHNNSTTGIFSEYDYKSSGGTQTTFERIVTIKPVLFGGVPSLHEVAVSVTVNWNGGTYSIGENLLDYEQNGS